MNVGSTSVDHSPALQVGFYCGYYGSRRKITSLAQGRQGVLRFLPSAFGNRQLETERNLRPSLALFFEHLIQQPAEAVGARMAQLHTGAASMCSLREFVGKVQCRQYGHA